VICLAPVFLSSLGCELQVTSSSRHVSLEILKGTLALETMGGNAVPLIEGPVSELGDPCCCEFLFGWTTTLHPYSLYARVDVG